MSQNSYQSYQPYEPGVAYFNAAAPSFDGSTTPRQQQPINSMSRSFSTYTFPFQATSSSMDHGLQALLSGHVSREPSVVYANPIANFYHDANGPWNSIRATSQARSLTPNAALSVPVPNLDYNSYRHAPASDVSDSGYASQAAASLPVVNLEPTDYNRECGDLPLQVNSFSFTAASSGSPAYDVQSFGAQSQDGHVQNPLLCTRCGETAKCPSDFKKHELKHIKPFVCQEPGCPRKEGFTTVNDLNRHKKSVHKIRGLTKSFRCDADRCKEKNKLWPRLDNFKQHLKRMHKHEDMDDMIQRSIVFGNPAAAASGSPHEEPVSSIDNTLAGIDEKTDTLGMLHQERNEDASNSLIQDLKASFDHGYSESRHWDHPQLQMYQGEQVQPAQSPEDCKPVQSSPRDAPKLRELADAATAASNTPKQPKSRGRSKSGAFKAQPPKQPFAMEDPQVRFLDQMSGVIATSITKNGSTNEGLEKAHVLRALLELADKRAVLTPASKPWDSDSGPKDGQNPKNTDRPPPGSGGARISTNEVRQRLSANASKLIQQAKGPVNPTADNRPGVECEHCGKILKRDCDLTKHMKRHTRPYGCTFPKCRRNFGSKNDWKRHEGSQHFQNEAWRCERRASAANDDGAAPYAQLFQVEVWRCEHRASAANDAPCGQLFYQKAIFEKHLREQHEMEAQERIDAELSARRIGRNGQSRFWCGFCRTIVELQKRGWDAWEERFDHIDAHFKKKQHIRDWIDVEANKTNAEVAAFMDGHNLEDSDPPPTGGDGGASSNTDQPNEVGPLHAAAEQADAYLFGMTGPKKNATGGSAKSSRKRERNEDGAEPLGQPPQKSRKAETLFFCCGCKQGPFAWSLYQNCIYCEHEFCERCDRRKHESSAEETVDYNLWSHVVGL